MKNHVVRWQLETATVVSDGTGLLRYNSVRFTRQSLHKTRAVLADECGISVKTLKRIESGHIFPDTYLAQRLAKNLGYSILGAPILFWEGYEDV